MFVSKDSSSRMCSHETLDSQSLSARPHKVRKAELLKDYIQNSSLASDIPHTTTERRQLKPLKGFERKDSFSVLDGTAAADQALPGSNCLRALTLGFLWMFLTPNSNILVLY